MSALDSSPLRHSGGRHASVAFHYDCASVAFVYVCGLAQLSSTCDPVALVRALNRLYTAFDGIVARRGAYKVMAIADMYLVVTGVPEAGDAAHARRLLDTVSALVVEAHGSARHTLEGQPLRVKAGLHCGPLAAGVIGTHTRNFHVFGDTVNLASRMCSTGEVGRVQVSDAFRQALVAQDRFVDLRYTLTHRGAVAVKGKGAVQAHWAAPAGGTASVPSAAAQSLSLRSIVDGSVDSASGSRRGSTASIDSVGGSSRGQAAGSLRRTSLLLQGINGAPPARRDLLREMHASTAAGSHRALVKGHSLHHLAATPSVYRLKGRYKTASTSSFTSGDHDQAGQQRLVQVRMEAQSAVLGHFHNPRLEALFTAVSRRGVWKHFHLHVAILAFTAVFLVTMGLTIDAPVSTAAATLAWVGTAGAAVQVSAGCAILLARRVGAWEAQLYRHCSRILLGGMVAQLLVTVCLAVASQQRLAMDLFRYTALTLLAPQMVPHIPSLLRFLAGCACVWTAGSVASAALTPHPFTTAEVVPASLALLGAAASGLAMAFAKDEAARRGFLVRLHTGQQARKAKALLRNMLPSPWHADCIMRGEPVVEFLQHVTLLYSDIVGYTALSATLEPEALIRLLDRLYRAFDAHLDALGLYKVETIGDAFVVLGGVRRVAGDGACDVGTGHHFSHSAWQTPGPAAGLLSAMQSPATVDFQFRKADTIAMTDTMAAASAAAGEMPALPPLANSCDMLHPTAAVAHFAMAMLDDVEAVAAEAGVPFSMRIGMHVGSVVGGIIGSSRPRYFMWGFDTILGNAMESEGTPGQIMLSAPAAGVLVREGFQVDPGPTVEVQGTLMGTSFLRGKGSRTVPHPAAPAVAPERGEGSPGGGGAAAGAPLPPLAERTETSADLGSAVGLDSDGDSVHSGGGAVACPALLKV